MGHVSCLIPLSFYHTSVSFLVLGKVFVLLYTPTSSHPQKLVLNIIRYN